MVTAGLSGGIASGKTTVAHLFGELGAALIDADQIAREVVEPGREGLARIAACFGVEMLNGQGRLDRARLGALVFGDSGRRQELNALLHPLIAGEIRARISRLRQSGFDGVAVVDVPLLFECGWHAMFDRTIVVSCDPDMQRRRLMQRSGLDRAQADARIAAQMPLLAKKEAADFVIDNQGTPQGLRPAVAAVYAQLAALL
jgi:dephospho-CoA kinase